MASKFLSPEKAEFFWKLLQQKGQDYSKIDEIVVRNDADKHMMDKIRTLAEYKTAVHFFQVCTHKDKMRFNWKTI